MPTKVLDSWALLALLKGEPAAGKVEILLNKASAKSIRLLLSVINWGEVYYIIARAGSLQTAEAVMQKIAVLPVEIVPVGDDLLIARQAAIYKATKNMSYADCFAAALAKTRRAQLVTGDSEFESVKGEIKIDWLK